MAYNGKEVRKSKKMSQEELAKASGVSRTIISGLENGSITVTTTKTLKLIADAMNEPVSSIFSF